MSYKKSHNTGLFLQQLFLEGMPHLHSQMRRIKQVRRQLVGSSRHPDFYKLPLLLPLHVPPPQENLNLSGKVPAKTSSKPSQTLRVPQAMQELSSDQEAFVETQARQGSMEALQQAVQTQNEFLKLLKSIKSQLSTEDCAVAGSVSGRASDVASSISSQSQRPIQVHMDYNSLLKQAMRLRVPSELNFISRIPSIRSADSTPHQDHRPVETPHYSLNGFCPLLTSSREAFTER